MWQYILRGLPTTTLSKQSYDFQVQNPFNKRRDEARRIITKYPDMIPLIIERATPQTNPILPKEKYLVNRDLTVGNFIRTMREHIALNSSRTFLITLNSTYTPHLDEKLGELYNRYKDRDQFVYLSYQII